MTMQTVVDVYQGCDPAQTDYPRLHAEGVFGLIAKLGQAFPGYDRKYWLDPKFIEHTQRAQDAGIRVAGYFWPDPFVNIGDMIGVIETQLNNAVKARVELDGIADDFEQYGTTWHNLLPHKTPQQLSDINQLVIHRTDLLLPGHVVGYSRRSFILEHMRPALAWARLWRWWMASYPFPGTLFKDLTWPKFRSIQPVDFSRQYSPDGWPDDVPTGMWQWTGDQAVLPGLDGELDGNIVKNWFEFWGHVTPPGDEDMDPQFIKDQLAIIEQKNAIIDSAQATIDTSMQVIDDSQAAIGAAVDSILLDLAAEEPPVPPPPPAPKQAQVIREVNVRPVHSIDSTVMRVMQPPVVVTVFEEWESDDKTELWVRIHETRQEWCAMKYKNLLPFLEYL